MGEFAGIAATKVISRDKQYVVKVRHRSQPPTPWKWEIYDSLHLVTASNESFASQAEAHAAGHEALNRLMSQVED